MKSKKKVYLIAEIGWNHLGNIKLAEKMIRSAKENGADYCKFQTWSVNNLVDGPWDNDGRRKIYQKAQLTKEKHKKLLQLCNKHKVHFLTSIFNIKDLEFLKKLNKRIIKIPSHEIYNMILIEKCLESFDKVLISTGASKWSEILSISKLRNFKKKAVLMHCVSSYPCEDKNINLKRINDLEKLTNKIGYSGHASHVHDAILSITMGATYIEKHFTINKKLPGRDNRNAILPDDLKIISDFRDKINLMKIYKGKNLQSCEMDIFKNYRGRWGGE